MHRQAYYTSYQLPCIITRGNNVYGPHQYPEKLIPKFILLASKGAMLPIHGSGASLRSFLCVNTFMDIFQRQLTMHLCIAISQICDGRRGRVRCYRAQRSGRRDVQHRDE